jgi:hypothetical protein
MSEQLSLLLETCAPLWSDQEIAALAEAILKFLESPYLSTDRRTRRTQTPRVKALITPDSRFHIPGARGEEHRRELRKECEHANNPRLLDSQHQRSS